MPPERDVQDSEAAAARLEVREKKRQELRSAMETARKEFVQAAADALASWYESTTVQMVRANRQRAEELAQGGRLGQLKAGLQGLMNSTRDKVKEALSPDGLWETACRAPVQPHEPSPSLNAPLQRIADRLGDLLGSHGLSLSAPRSFAWPDPMHEALSRYRDAWQQIRQLEEASAKDGRENDEAKAQSLWDNA